MSSEINCDVPQTTVEQMLLLYLGLWEEEKKIGGPLADQFQRIFQAIHAHLRIDPATHVMSVDGGEENTPIQEVPLQCFEAGILLGSYLAKQGINLGVGRRREDAH